MRDDQEPAEQPPAAGDYLDLLDASLAELESGLRL
jgi:hypothetical protein